MKKLTVIIIFLILVIGFQINASSSRDIAYNNALRANLGMLDSRLEPFEKQAVDFLYSRLYHSAQETQNLTSGSSQENLALRFNQRLDSLTDKYLGISGRNEESKFAASVGCTEKDYTKIMKSRLYQLMTPEDFEYYTAISENFKETHSFTQLNDMRGFLDTYPQICTDYIIGYILFEDELYRTEFEKRYWKDIEHDAYSVLNSDPLNIKDQASYFYARHNDRFITDFSAESVADDMAEAFYYFMNADKPDSQQLWGQKIRFFYEFDELSLLRQQTHKD